MTVKMTINALKQATFGFGHDPEPDVTTFRVFKRELLFFLLFHVQPNYQCLFIMTSYV